MITLDKGKIVRMETLLGQAITNRIRVVTVMTGKVANDMGARWLLFDSQTVVRGGFTTTELDNVFVGATFTHEIEKIGKLELTGAEVSKFKVFRTGDGKKKPKRLMLAFQVSCRGNPFELIEHIIKVGKGEGSCTISAPQQESLLDTKKKPAEKDAAGKFQGAEAEKLKYKGKGAWHAVIHTLEIATGWISSYTVQSNNSGHATELTDQIVWSSESEAREKAARGVFEWAQNIKATGVRTEKREAEKAMEWAQKYMSKQPTLITDNKSKAAGDYPD